MLNDWLLSPWMEVLGTVFAIVYLFLSVKENIWLWATGFLTSFFYLIIFFDERLYADMGLQLYYLLISVYGWLVWKWGRYRSGRPKMPIQQLNLKLGLKLLMVGLIIYLLVVLALLKLPAMVNIAESDLPYWDAFTTTGGIVATWMLARKIIEHWLIWIVVDLVSSGMYFYKDLMVTMILYLIYTLFAIWGYKEWFRNMKLRDGKI